VESENVGLKLNIQKTKIMASGPITSWQIDGETVETVSDFIFWGSLAFSLLCVNLVNSSVQKRTNIWIFILVLSM